LPLNVPDAKQLSNTTLTAINHNKLISPLLQALSLWEIKAGTFNLMTI
jgi:hypothetical protein